MEKKYASSAKGMIILITLRKTREFCVVFKTITLSILIALRNRRAQNWLKRKNLGGVDGVAKNKGNVDAFHEIEVDGVDGLGRNPRNSDDWVQKCLAVLKVLRVLSALQKAREICMKWTKITLRVLSALWRKDFAISHPFGGARQPAARFKSSAATAA